jgi:3'-phosphoadenosine 5'-phosphosulfate sulfotransferase (PAPS reductase)/FAD synthetase
MYQMEKSFTLKVSDKCCHELKKKVASDYEKHSRRSIVLTGMLREEGGQRENLNCIITDKSGNIKKFHPLAVVSSDFENWYINLKNIKLCELYYPPYNFKRTGCKGCPFSLDLQDQLDTMALFLPEEKKQCEYIWKPIYDEYRRIGYRLRTAEQPLLFD